MAGRKRLRGSSVAPAVAALDAAAAASPENDENGGCGDGSPAGGKQPRRERFNNSDGVPARRGRPNVRPCRPNDGPAFPSLASPLRPPSSPSPPPPPPLSAAAAVAEVDHGCLLIPAAFVFWWYWTKRAAARACRQSRRMLSRIPLVRSRRRRLRTSSGRRGDGGAAEALSCVRVGDGSGNNAEHDDGDGANLPDDDNVGGGSDEYQTWEEVVMVNAGRGDGRCRGGGGALGLVKWIRGPSELRQASRQWKDTRDDIPRLESIRRRIGADCVDGYAGATAASRRPEPTDTSHAGVDSVLRAAYDGGGDEDDVLSRSWDYIQDWTDIELCFSAARESVQHMTGGSGGADDLPSSCGSVEAAVPSARYRPLL